MEYEFIKHKANKEDLVKFRNVKGKSLGFSLKALEKQEFEMPAVCH